MDKAFYMENRRALYAQLAPGSALVIFSGQAPRKTADEMYPFFADRSFVYMTGVEEENTILLAVKWDASVTETMFLVTKNPREERWTGASLKPDRAAEISGIAHFANVTEFPEILRRLAYSEIGRAS